MVVASRFCVEGKCGRWILNLADPCLATAILVIMRKLRFEQLRHPIARAYPTRVADEKTIQCYGPEKALVSLG